MPEQFQGALQVSFVLALPGTRDSDSDSDLAGYAALGARYVFNEMRHVPRYGGVRVLATAFSQMALFR